MPLSLAGPWRVRLDQADVGCAVQWFAQPLAEASAIRLPGTTDQAGLGHALNTHTMTYPVDFPYTLFPGVKDPGRADARGFLARSHLFLGAAWYEREITVPSAWQDCPVTLRLERALWQTDAWLDGRHVGTGDSLATPHEYSLGALAPGRHRLTIRVDNRMVLNLSTITHAYGPETQSRWNGLVGRLELTANAPASIRRLDVFPAPDRRSVRVVSVLDNTAGHAVAGRLRFRLLPMKSDAPLGQQEVLCLAQAGEIQTEAVLPLDVAALPWDEFSPVRYRLVAEFIPDDGARAACETVIGFRHLERQGRAVRLNGRRLFLRGTLDCAVYPRTGHPPMTLAEWERVFRTVKDHGFNHVRFHTWCPPEAAFEAADRLGLYLAPETAAWVDDWTRATATQPPAIGRDAKVSEFIRAEMRRIVEAYGNHPSFTLFCIGNEFGMEGTDWEAVAGWVEEAKRRDPRRLYTGCAARRHLAPDDLWVTHAVNGKAARGEGPPRTDWDFTAAAQATDVPVIAHETGQRPVFPDFAGLLPKFTGPLKPYNYARLRAQLEANGLGDQVRAFARASARFQLVQYKAEHEGMRRTADYAGYQLLMLNDFTGQSEALVGILDPFWEPKGVVSAAEVRAWNAPTVPLARFARFTWSTDEPFAATIEVAHHGARDLERPKTRWELVAGSGRVLGRGRFERERVPTGGLTRLGEIRVPLGRLDAAAALTLTVRVGEAVNAWRVWAYPKVLPDTTGDALVVTRFDAAAEQALAAGRTVVWLANGAKGPRAARTGFASVYWSAGWWGNPFSSLGILCDPRHPALAGFPTDGHSDWQWRELTEGATTFLLDGAPAGCRPIVQPVPDFHYSKRLGQVFEARVGGGRLIVCGYDLTSDLEQRHAARQFRHSLWRYANAKTSPPPTSLPLELVRELAGNQE